VVVPDDIDPDGVAERFHELHGARFGFALPEDPIECVHLRVSVWGEQLQGAAPRWPSKPDAAPIGRRQMSLLDEAIDRVPVYRRTELGAGARLPGPAILEEETATTIVPSDAKAEVDGAGNVLIEVSP
jgi:N-methylhydantoinase A